MPQVTFLLKDGTKKTLEAQNGLSLMEVALKNQITGIEGSCGGGLACATCHVYVHPDWQALCLPPGEETPSETEEDMLDLAFDVRKSSRLCCQILVSDALDGLIVALPGTKTDW